MATKKSNTTTTPAKPKVRVYAAKNFFDGESGKGYNIGQEVIGWSEEKCKAQKHLLSFTPVAGPGKTA